MICHYFSQTGKKATQVTPQICGFSSLNPPVQSKPAKRTAISAPLAGQVSRLFSGTWVGGFGEQVTQVMQLPHAAPCQLPLKGSFLAKAPYKLSDKKHTPGREDLFDLPRVPDPSASGLAGAGRHGARVGHLRPRSFVPGPGRCFGAWRCGLGAGRGRGTQDVRCEEKAHRPCQTRPWIFFGHQVLA